MINVINDWLIILLLSVSQYYYVGHTAHVIKAIQELTFYLCPTINGFRSKVGIPIKCYIFKRSHKLFHEGVTFCASIVVSLDEVRNMLPGVPLAIKLFEFRWLTAMTYIKCVYPLCIQFLI